MGKVFRSDAVASLEACELVSFHYTAAPYDLFIKYQKEKSQDLMEDLCMRMCVGV